jgi:hypothetical protein
MNFQQMEHDEESVYNNDEDMSIQTDDMSYLSSSYESDDEVSVKIGGAHSMEGHQLEDEMEGGMSFRSSTPTQAIFYGNDNSYTNLYNRASFSKIMKVALSQKQFKDHFFGYVNGNQKGQYNVNSLNEEIKKYVFTSNTQGTNGTKSTPKNVDDKYKPIIEKNIENLFNEISDKTESIENVFKIDNDKLFLSNKFAIELMFCLTHFIHDGCPINDGKGEKPNSEKFKRRYEYRALFIDFYKDYNFQYEKENTQDKSSSDQQKILMKYLILLLSFECDKMKDASFIKSFSIPEPEKNANDFKEMLERLLNLFSISGVDIVKTFCHRTNILKGIEQSKENQDQCIGDEMNTRSWLNEHLQATIQFYENLPKIKSGRVMKSYSLDFDNVNKEYFQSLNAEFKLNQLKKHISDFVETNDGSKVEISNQELFFLEYVTGKKEGQGKYFYNHNLPIIPYNENQFPPYSGNNVQEKNSVSNPMHQNLAGEVNKAPNASEVPTGVLLRVNQDVVDEVSQLPNAPSNRAGK